MQPVFPVSETTQKILENFSGISTSLLLAEGQHQKTIGPGNSSSVLVFAQFPEAWPKETAFFNLAAFLKMLDTFKKPDIRFNTDAMVISERDSPFQIKARYSDPSNITSMVNKVPPFENPAVQFAITKQDLKMLMTTASTLGLSHFTIRVDKGAVNIIGNDPKNSGSNSFDLSIPAKHIAVNDAAFVRSMRFQVAHVALLMDGDYNISVAEKWPYAYFAHKVMPVTYYVAAEP